MTGSSLAALGGHRPHNLTVFSLPTTTCVKLEFPEDNLGLSIGFPQIIPCSTPTVENQCVEVVHYWVLKSILHRATLHTILLIKTHSGTSACDIALFASLSTLLHFSQLTLNLFWVKMSRNGPYEVKVANYQKLCWVQKILHCIKRISASSFLHW